MVSLSAVAVPCEPWPEDVRRHLVSGHGIDPQQFHEAWRVIWEHLHAHAAGQFGSGAHYHKQD
jgi:hypothetical protein